MTSTSVRHQIPVSKCNSYPYVLEPQNQIDHDRMGSMASLHERTNQAKIEITDKETKVLDIDFSDEVSDTPSIQSLPLSDSGSLRLKQPDLHRFDSKKEMLRIKLSSDFERAMNHAFKPAQPQSPNKIRAVKNNNKPINSNRPPNDFASFRTPGFAGIPGLPGSHGISSNNFSTKTVNSMATNVVHHPSLQSKSSYDLAASSCPLFPDPISKYEQLKSKNKLKHKPKFPGRDESLGLEDSMRCQTNKKVKKKTTPLSLCFAGPRMSVDAKLVTVKRQGLNAVDNIVHKVNKNLHKCLDLTTNRSSSTTKLELGRSDSDGSCATLDLNLTPLDTLEERPGLHKSWFEAFAEKNSRNSVAPLGRGTQLDYSYANPLLRDNCSYKPKYKSTKCSMHAVGGSMVRSVRRAAYAQFQNSIKLDDGQEQALDLDKTTSDLIMNLDDIDDSIPEIDETEIGINYQSSTKVHRSKKMPKQSMRSVDTLTCLTDSD